MKIQRSILRRVASRILVLCCVILAAGEFSSWAAPPRKREPAVVRGLEKVGDFFFKFARKLEQPGYGDDDHRAEAGVIYESRRDTDHRPAPSTGLVLPPGYRPGDEYRYPSAARTPPVTRRQVPPQQVARLEPFTPPTFQPNPQPYPLYPNQGKVAPRSSLSLPVPQPTVPSGTAMQRQAPATPGTTAPFNPPVTPPAWTSAGSTHEEKVAAPTPSANPTFATPVPGRRGFVYPPGVEQDMKNMLDVRDFAPGQKVRDPRTGQIFLVPPK